MSVSLVRVLRIPDQIIFGENRMIIRVQCRCRFLFRLCQLPLTINYVRNSLFRLQRPTTMTVIKIWLALHIRNEAPLVFQFRTSKNIVQPVPFILVGIN